MLDDLVLWFQARVDRLARWARLRVPVQESRRRFLIIQIDGLARRTLDRALKTGRVPALARMLAAGRLARRELSVGLPSSTASFQASLMYGVHPDIPGFHWYDKRERADRYFPRPGVADLIEERHARGRRGILAGGACYGCIFTGGAEESLWTFSKLLHPTRAGGALIRAPLSAVLLAWVILKCLALTVVDLVRSGLRFIADPLGALGGLQWFLFRIGLSIWARQFFTLAVSADLYRGVPAVYVNYVEYDVAAHMFGPEHPQALRALRRVDNSIAQLARILSRLPEHAYDLYVLSDHGQTPTRPFERVSGGATIEEAVLAVLTSGAGVAHRSAGPRGVRISAKDLRQLRREHPRGFFQRFLNYLERDFLVRMRDGGAEGRAEGLRVVAAGPNAFIYFTDSPEPVTAEEIERRHPGLPAALSRLAGVGFVLARSTGVPVCWYRGQEASLEPGSRGGPFDQRPDREIVLRDLSELMAMPSAGDLVLYGIGAAGGDVSFLEERGAHAGPSEAELQTFLLHPPAVTLPPAPLTHPIQLYPHFAAYGAEAAR
jgi:hypothetical protein